MATLLSTQAVALLLTTAVTGVLLVFLILGMKYCTLLCLEIKILVQFISMLCYSDSLFPLKKHGSRKFEYEFLIIQKLDFLEEEKK